MSIPPAVPPRGGLTLGRIARLAAKELKETLRDRRTIITLVLMPLLVYPVLSVAFRQFLLSSFQHSGELRWIIASTSQADGRAFMVRLQQGDMLLQQQGSRAATKSADGSLILGPELGGTEPPFEQINFVIVDDLEESVRDQEIDLGVRLVPAPPDAPRDAEETFQLIFRPNTPISRQAASYVERRLRAVNDFDLRRRLQRKGEPALLKAAWRLTPVAEEKGHSFWLGTLVPLVLILMTITGAVYPAIDLTAGERERGTLEALMAAPVPRLALLLAKYIAVVTVSMLTAVVNLTAMTVTISASGLAGVLFGDAGLSPSAIAVVLGLLVLFAAFFSAVLLSITSFARSFKEAQAYVIPLMVVALVPGFITVMPGLELGPLLSVTPLANIVLLARDVLRGDASPLWGTVAVLSTALYGALALTLAARIFGSDSILYGSEGSWSDLFRPPQEPRTQATIPGALTALAIIAPLFVIAGGILAQLQAISMPAQLAALAGTSLFLFVVLPLLLARLQSVALAPGFQFHAPPPLSLLGAVLLGCCVWVLAYDLIILCQDLGIATLSLKKLEEARPGLQALLDRFNALPLAFVLLAFAITPAIGEELFFRGYLLGALRGRMPAWAAIALSAAIFGLFHASVGGLIAIERVLSSTLLGVVLGWVCWTSRSVWPGILLHALNNSLMLLVARFGDELKARGWDLAQQRYLPLAVLAIALAGMLAGAALVWLGRARQTSTAISTSFDPEPEATA
jgi:ABC-2 type transport system permease protein/sodium transport system permease protein